MAMAPEALQKVLQEIELKMIQSQMELSAMRQQISQKQRDIRLNELTIKELKEIPETVGVWEGVGKMFMNVPLAQHLSELEKEKKGNEDQLTAMNKKLHYLETTYKNSKQNIDDILGSSQR
ncbi:putative Prefoldin subunit 1 [Lipomyces oligophaga]|uniref:putative Prefoldin subunit 1 n=1 Tax=Lipomyces oligophaga TaxID=45792 RepID=UPI0034CFF17C